MTGRFPAPTFRLLLLWVAVTVVLICLPPALNAFRATEFVASVEAFPVDHPDFGPVRNRVSYVRRLLDDPLVAPDTVANAGFSLNEASLLPRVTVLPTPRSALVSVRADSPDNARDLVNALAAQIANASARDLAARGQSMLDRVRDRLTGSAPRDAERRRLLARLRRLEAVVTQPPFGLVIGPRPSAPRPSRAVDRALDRLPGPLPPRTDPLWSAVAGLALALLFCVTSYVVWTRRQRVTAIEPARGPAPETSPLSEADRFDATTFAREMNGGGEALLLSLSEERRSGAVSVGRVADFADRFLPSRGWRRVLLLGCGLGDEAILLAERGYDITIIDVDSPSLWFTQHRLSRRGLAATVILGDPARPALPGTFDVIFASYPELTTRDRDALRRELKKALRGGGMLIEREDAAPAMSDGEHLTDRA